ncbi:MAG: winged helix-turn-helix transcriptional regulator [Gammaproteobacteria bacterium]|nr:Lrp/AsnC ligand binding domain-containing protein [Gammaproteobacteria bacterium]NNC98287.1 winged helix-turn-helix transcriptional regulator [Gammaproteobacteria bacterium]NNM14529.1 winged helix-turn-helix transcriptional regulator [Gammaproteobacteria bacterium]
MKDISLGKTDLKILKALQENGRIKYSELANQVGLTTSPCIERIKRLERDGYISAYTAILNPKKLNASMVVLVQVRLDRSIKNSFEKFRKAVLNLPQVQECYLVTGNYDFTIKARVSDMDAYRKFLESDLLSIAGVQESTSSVVIESIKESMALTL